MENERWKGDESKVRRDAERDDSTGIRISDRCFSLFLSRLRKKSRYDLSLSLSLSFFFSARDFETVHRACNCIPRYITRLEEIMLLVFYIDRGERNSNKISRTS